MSNSQHRKMRVCVATETQIVDSIRIFGFRASALFFPIVLLWLLFVGELLFAFRLEAPIEGDKTGLAEVWLVKRLWTGNSEPVENAVLIVVDGKVAAAGRRSEISIPATAIVHDHSDRVIIPGLVIGETSIGRPAPDERTITPHFRAVDGLDLFEEHPRLLAAGITTVHINPGTERFIPGQSVIVKLSGSYDTRVLRESESLQVVLSSAAWNPPTIYEPPIGANSEIRPLEPTKPQLAGSLAEAVGGLRLLLDAAKLNGAAAGSERDRDILEVMAAVREAKMPVRITARSASEISAAKELVHDYELNSILVDPQFLTAAFENTNDIPFNGFVLFPTKVSTTIANVPVPDDDDPRPDDFWEAAEFLKKCGRLDRTAIGGLNASELEDILLHAGLLKRSSLSPTEILGLLTSNAAKLLGVADRVGTLEPGKDADFVVLTDDPFARGCQVTETRVSGVVVYVADKGESPAPTRIVRAASIYTPAGKVENASIVVAGNKIAAVGGEVSSPADAQLDEFPGGVIIPGMIDLNSEIGFGGSLNESLPLQTSLANHLVSEDKTVQFVRQSGITTVLASSSRLPSPVVAFKLSDRPRVIKDPVALRFDVTGNLTNVEASLRQTLSQGKGYAESWTKYDKAYAEYQAAIKAWEEEMKKIADAEAKAKAEAEAKAAEESKQPAPNNAEPPKENQPPESQGEKPAEGQDKPEATGDSTDAKQEGADAAKGKPETEKTDSEKAAAPTTDSQDANKPKGPEKPVEPEKPRKVDNLEPFRAVFSGDLSVIAVAQQSRAIELAVKIFAEEFGLNVIIAGCEDADLTIEALRNEKVSVAIGPGLTARRDKDSIVNLPQRLATAGVRFGFQSSAASGASQLPQAVMAATYRGLGSGDALRSFSSDPAEFLKLGSIGQIAAGRDADLVVLSGHPFDLGSEVIAVMIDGEWVFRKEKK